jgi:hypothetical protein
MARGRILSKKISLNRAVDNLSNDTSRLAFTWLIAHLDCRGRIHGDPLVLKSIVFPRRTDVTTDMMRDYITEWVKEKLVVWYEVNGDLWLQFPKFRENQPGLKDERETDSGFPSPEKGKVVELAPDLPFKEESDRVITTDDVLGITPATDELRSNSDHSTEPRDYSDHSTEIKDYSDHSTEPRDYSDHSTEPRDLVGISEFNISEFNIKPPPLAVAASPPLRIHKKPTKTTTTTTGPPDECLYPENRGILTLDAFGLFCRINDWIAATDGLYEPVEKPGDGSKEWGFLKRMAKKFENVNPDDFVCEVLELLHQKDKLRKGFINSWIAEEIGTCIDDIKREQKSWD